MNKPEDKQPSELNVITKCKDLIKHTYTLNNARRKLKRMRKLVDDGELSPDRVQASYGNGNSHHLLREMDKYYNSLFNNKEDNKECRKH